MISESLAASAGTSLSSQGRMMKVARQRITNFMQTTISLVFFLSWVPIIMFNLPVNLLEPKTDPDWLLKIYAFCPLTAMSTTLPNQIIYGFLNRNFQKVNC